MRSLLVKLLFSACIFLISVNQAHGLSGLIDTCFNEQPYLDLVKKIMPEYQPSVRNWKFIYMPTECGLRPVIPLYWMVELPKEISKIDIVYSVPFTIQIDREGNVYENYAFITGQRSPESLISRIEESEEVINFLKEEKVKFVKIRTVKHGRTIDMASEVAFHIFYDKNGMTIVDPKGEDQRNYFPFLSQLSEIENDDLVYFREDGPIYYVDGTEYPREVVESIMQKGLVTMIVITIVFFVFKKRKNWKI